MENFEAKRIKMKDAIEADEKQKLEERLDKQMILAATVDSMTSELTKALCRQLARLKGWAS